MRFILPLLLAIAVLFYLKRAFAPEKKQGRPEIPPEINKKAFFAPAEKLFFAALVEAVGDEYHLFPKVPVLDLLEMKGRKKVLDKVRDYASGARVEAALFHKDTYQLQAAVIVQELSAANYHDKEWLKNLLEKAGISVLRLHGRKNWDPAWLKQKIQELLTAVSNRETSKVTPFPKKNPSDSTEQKDAEK